MTPLRLAPWLLLFGSLAACGGGDEPAPVTVGGGLSETLGAPPGRLRFLEERADIGVVYQHETRPVEIPFVVEDGPVVVEDVDVSCGCTDVHFELEGGQPYALGDVMPAGTRGVLRGTYESETREGPQVTAIAVRGRMAESPVRTEVRAEVRPVFRVEPSRVHFGTVLDRDLEREPPRREVTVVARGPFRVERWSSMPEGVRVEVVGEPEPTGEEGEVVQRMAFSLAPGAPRGLIDQAAIAATDLGAELVVPVLANVVGPVVYAPEERLQFGIWPAGQERTRRVKVRPADESVELPRPEVELSGPIAEQAVVEVDALSEQEGAPGWLITVRVPRDAPAGPMSGTLTLRYPEGADLEPHSIRVQGRIRETR